MTDYMTSVPRLHAGGPARRLPKIPARVPMPAVKPPPESAPSEADRLRRRLRCARSLVLAYYHATQQARRIVSMPILEQLDALVAEFYFDVPADEVDLPDELVEQIAARLRAAMETHP